MAAAALGFVHAGERSAESLRAWIEALVASRQLREAHAAVERAGADAERRGDAGLAAVVAAERAKLAAAADVVPIERPLPRPTSAALRAAYAAEAAGRVDDAVAALGSAAGNDGAPDAFASADPAELAHFGDLLWRKGDEARARRAYARARIALDESGASMALVPVESYRASAAFWAGDQLVLLRGLSPIRYGSSTFAALERWSPSSSSAPLSRALLTLQPGAALALDDGARLVVTADLGVSIIDALSGAILERLELGVERPRVVAAAGNGDALGVLVPTSTGVELHDRGGRLLDSFVLKGTTPTITRVYRGPGAYHDNILADSPTWPTALAVTSDFGHVAIGGSDSKVRLVDRRAKTTKLLEIAWTYEERRGRGGNPDLNEPLDLRFSGDARELVVLYAHGEIVTWSVATGAQLARLAGPCSRDEALIEKNRYVEPGGAREEPTPADMERCGRGSVGVLSPDLRWAATSLMFGVRIRSLPTGAPAALLVGSLLPSDMLAFSKSGRLALVDHYGATAFWSPSQGLVHFRPRPEDTGPIAPSLSANGRFLTFDHGRVDVVWDLERASSPTAALGSGAQLLAIAPDGARSVVKTAAGVELRGPGGAVAKLGPARGETRAELSASGDRLLVDVQGESRRVVVRDLRRGIDTPIPVPADSEAPVLSPDGLRLVAFGREAPPVVFDTQTGNVVAKLDAVVNHVAIAPDASFVATLARTAQRARGRATLHRLGGPSPSTPSASDSIDVEGWTAGVAVSPEGDEILILMESSVVLWRPSKGERVDVPGDWQHGIRRAHYAAGGRVVFFERYDEIEIRRRDETMTLVATLYPLLSGGWVVLSADGAVDGSADAPESLIARASRRPEASGSASRAALLLSGRAAWDRFYVQGVLSGALEGDSVSPPAPGRPLAPPVEPPKTRIITRTWRGASERERIAVGRAVSRVERVPRAE